MSCGINGKAKASLGSAIVLVYRHVDGQIVHIGAFIAGQDGIKPDTWYYMNSDGKPIEAAPESD
jgi:hypothetical protein